MTGAGFAANLTLSWRGSGSTMWLTAICTVLSLPLGAVMGIARTAPIAGLRLAGRVYVELLRNVPPLILMFFFFFGLPAAGHHGRGFHVRAGGHHALHQRLRGRGRAGGDRAVDRGQVDAVRSLGFSYFGALRHVVFPQAVAMVLPALGNIMIGIVKNTALVATIGVADLMHQGEVIESHTFATFSTFATVALFYLSIIIPLSIGVNTSTGGVFGR